MKLSLHNPFHVPPPYSAYELNEYTHRLTELTKLRDKAQLAGRQGEIERYNRDIEISQSILNRLLEKVQGHYGRK